jgi:hypothetical protein
MLSSMAGREIEGRAEDSKLRDFLKEYSGVKNDLDFIHHLTEMIHKKTIADSMTKFYYVLKFLCDSEFINHYAKSVKQEEDLKLLLKLKSEDPIKSVK